MNNNRTKIGSLNVEWAKMWETGILDAWSHQYIQKYGSITKAWDHKAHEYVKTMGHSNPLLLRFLMPVHLQLSVTTSMQ